MRGIFCLVALTQASKGCQSMSSRQVAAGTAFVTPWPNAVASEVEDFMSCSVRDRCVQLLTAASLRSSHGSGDPPSVQLRTAATA